MRPNFSGLPGIASRSRKQTGEIATLLTLFTLLVIGAGTLIGTKDTLRQNLRSYLPSAQSQCLQSTVKVKLNSQNGPVLTDAQMGDPEAWGVSNDTDSQTSPRWKFSDLPGNIAQHTFSFTPTSPSTNRSVKLFYDNRYQIAGTWCTDLSGGGTIPTSNPNSSNPNANTQGPNGCEGVRPSRSDTIRGFTVACGAHIEYGWILTDGGTPTPTVRPTSATQPTTPPAGGPGDMEVKVVTLDWPQKTNHFRGDKPSSCTRNPSDERPLYLSTFTIDATNAQTGQKYSATAHKNEGHVSFHGIPAGQYNLAVRGIGGRGYSMWDTCASKVWDVTAGGTVAAGRHTLAYVALQNETRGIYETETNESQCTGNISDESGQRGVSNLVQGVRGSMCYYGTKKSAGPGGCVGPDLQCSGVNSSRAGDGDGICRDAGLGSYVGWCSAGNINNNACCNKTPPTPTTRPNPTSSLNQCEAQGNVCTNGTRCTALGGTSGGVRGCTNSNICCTGLSQTSTCSGHDATGRRLICSPNADTCGRAGGDVRPNNQCSVGATCCALPAPTVGPNAIQGTVTVNTHGNPFDRLYVLYRSEEEFERGASGNIHAIQIYNGNAKTNNQSFRYSIPNLQNKKYVIIAGAVLGEEYVSDFKQTARSSSCSNYISNGKYCLVSAPTNQNFVVEVQKKSSPTAAATLTPTPQPNSADLGTITVNINQALSPSDKAVRMKTSITVKDIFGNVLMQKEQDRNPDRESFTWENVPKFPKATHTELFVDLVDSDGNSTNIIYNDCHRESAFRPNHNVCTFAEFKDTVRYSIGRDLSSSLLAADVDKNSSINTLDLAACLTQWARSSSLTESQKTCDTNADGNVNSTDFSLVLGLLGVNTN